jgi:endonuclease/exonuclease/phosphatase family metal-dependent hydrolase
MFVQMPVGPAFVAVLAAAVIALTGCISSARLAPSVPVASCADTSAGVRWIRIAPPNEYHDLDRWCAGVGAPIVDLAGAAAPPNAAPPWHRLAIVSWNTHVGGGDLRRMIADIRTGRATGGAVDAFVLLLQEAYREGEAVPRFTDAFHAAAAQRPDGRESVVDAARQEKLSLLYVPSMRNGASADAREDRGNAILSSLPLTDPLAIELPLERQRRVAVAATTGGVRVVSTHFSNLVAHHLWVLAEPGRVRQARALAQVLRDRPAPLILAGDFNSWFGNLDAAYRTLAHEFSAAPSADPRPTFGRLRLDHVLFRIPAGWHASVRRADDRHGSDHYPLIAIIER